VRPEAWAALTQLPQVKREVRKGAARVRTDARRGAPKRTGAGARSIGVASTYDRATKTVGFKVTWDRKHFYMGFYNNGAVFASGRRIRAQQFLEEAARKNQ
jgi:hypothetical protein